jgi:2-polyprenyl-3-methyl-5-hydroxy-6-metoxy-1,4-benzoquinol methylase
MQSINSNDSHTIACRFIHERLRQPNCHILAIGCNTGYFGEVLVKAGHHVTVTGVELLASAEHEARKNLSAVFIGSVESFLATEEFQAARYDCITFGDVLEYIPDPSAMLTAAITRLNDDGIVVVSVANITHIAIKSMVCEGRSIYTDRGIMDQTHWQCFNKEATVSLMESAGLSVDAIAAVRVPAKNTGVALPQAILDRLAFQTAAAGAEEVLQYIAVGTLKKKFKKFQISPRRVLVLWPVADYCLGDIRLRGPLAAWSEMYGGDFRCIAFADCRDIDIEWANVIVIQRESSLTLLYKIRQWRSLGKAVIFDIDDLLLDVPNFLQGALHYQDIHAYIKAALAGANHVTTTTERLKAELTSYAHAVSVTANYSQYWGAIASHNSCLGQRIKLLIASSDTIRLDFVVPALQKILADTELSIEILAIGNTFNFLKKSGLEITGVPLFSYPEFLSFVAEQDNAIGIIPLEHSKFSSCKSPIKYLDYACCGLPAICSNVPPYSDVITNFRDGVLVPNDANLWYEAIRLLALNANLRSEIACAAKVMANQRFSRFGVAEIWQNVIETAITHTQLNPVKAASKISLYWKQLWRIVSMLLSCSFYQRLIRFIHREGFTRLIMRILKSNLWRI